MSVEFTPTDERLIRSMTGQGEAGEIPDDIKKEYSIWLPMFHRGGSSGPLGPIGVIAMLRHLGYTGPKAAEQPKHIDWRGYPQDGSTRIQALFFGSWHDGRFLGFGPNGTLAIRLDDDYYVREVSRHVVRLYEKDADTPPAPSRELPVPALEPGRLKIILPVTDEAPDDDEIPTVEHSLSAAGGGDGLEVGSAVWVETDDDILDGTIRGFDGDQVEVVVDGGNVFKCDREFVKAVR